MPAVWIGSLEVPRTGRVHRLDPATEATTLYLITKTSISDPA